ncbi:MAG: response regulator [Candidatus Margulisiibacteriota bacterium]|jgi:DNA-binding NtrC family response regulator
MVRQTILIVDDEQSVRESLKLLLEDDYKIFTASNGEDGLLCIKQENVDLVLLDIRMPGISGLEVLAEIEKLYPLLEVIMVTATTEVDVAVESIHRGARNYITKPFDLMTLTSMIDKALQNRSKRLSQLQYSEHSVLAPLLNIPSMAVVQTAVGHAIEERKPIILEGANGTEKEELAYYIHTKSQQKRFIKIDCYAPGDLARQLTQVAEEIFQSIQEGKSSQLQGGATLYFNRVDILSENEQEDLLDFFHELLKENKDIFKLIRIISNMEEDLAPKVRKDKFDEELFHYLNGKRIPLPLLAERKSDLGSIIKYYLDNFNRRCGRTITLEPKCLQMLVNYDWPGNVAELVCLMQQLSLRCTKEAVTIEDLPLNIMVNTREANGLSLDSFLKKFEDNYIGKIKKLFPNLQVAGQKLGVPIAKLEK